MPIFKFKAKNFKGQEIEGTREAADKFDLAKSLRGRGFTLVDFEKEGKKGKLDFSFINFGGVSLSEKMIFTRNLSVMLGAGLPVSRALKILIKQARSRKFKKVLTDISSELVKGKSLSENMSEHKRVFSKLYVSMIKAGEKSGKMEESLRLLANQMEKDAALRRKVKGAMIYPSIVLLAMFGIGILMLVYVVPTLTSTFEELGVDLPPSTQIIVWLSDSLIANSLLLLSAFLVLAVSFVFLLRKPSVKKFTDGLFLRVPIIAPLVRKVNTARTARTLSSLIDSGVGILECLNTTAEVLQNVHYKNVLLNAKEEIQKGAPMSSVFKNAENVFPLLLGEMVAVGEETGKLSDMLLRLAVFYEEEVSQATKDMATVIEPILMIVIGAAVGFFAISMIKPMYSMMSGI